MPKSIQWGKERFSKIAEMFSILLHCPTFRRAETFFATGPGFYLSTNMIIKIIATSIDKFNRVAVLKSDLLFFTLGADKRIYFIMTYLPMHLFILHRGNPYLLLEHSGKIISVFKPYFPADLLYFKIGEIEILTGSLYFKSYEIMNGR